jgi:methionyl-tRNA synthetase
MGRLREMINFDGGSWSLIGKDDLLEAGHSIRKADLLFQKIEDEQVQAQLDKLMKTREDNEGTPTLPPVKEEISFDDFGSMDLRCATILEAEKVPKTKKLIRMQVDLGFEKRTIVSGIAEYYDPATLPGKRICVLANLASRKLKGIESQGMALLSENPDGSLYFVEPSADALNGSPVN